MLNYIIYFKRNITKAETAMFMSSTIEENYKRILLAAVLSWHRRLPADESWIKVMELAGVVKRARSRLSMGNIMMMITDIFETPCVFKDVDKNTVQLQYSFSSHTWNNDEYWMSTVFFSVHGHRFQCEIQLVMMTYFRSVLLVLSWSPRVSIASSSRNLGTERLNPSLAMNCYVYVA